MSAQELQNEAILVELGIASRPAETRTDPVEPRPSEEVERRDPEETEIALIAAVPQTTPWHQW